MEFEALVNAICAKVQERIAACEEVKAVDKPKLLVLADEHGTKCHECLECPGLNAHFAVECALSKEYAFDFNDYEGIIAFDLSNANLAKIALGILDTPYTKAFGEAILLGKKIFVPKEEVEFYAYKETSPKGYLNRFEEYLNLLRQCGVTVLPSKELHEAILDEAPAPTPVSTVFVSNRADKEITVKKKVVTERDLIEARAAEATLLVADEKSIITDLAKDYAGRFGIVIERRKGVR